MAKQKNKINVKQMSLQQLRNALVNASGGVKNNLAKELQKRERICD